MKKNTFPFLFTALVIFGFLIFSACSKEESTEKLVIFEDETLVLSYDSNDSAVRLYIDLIGDLSDNIDEASLGTDIYSIVFDVNNNGILDPNIDFRLSRFDLSVCHSSLISETSSSGCSFWENLWAVQYFGSTENSPEDHVFFQVSIPLELLSSDSKANFYLRYLDAESGITYYPSPSGPEFFSNTFEITW